MSEDDPDGEEEFDPELLEQTRRQINRLVKELVLLSERDISPGEYFGEFLDRILRAIAAPAGAIWVKTPQGNLQLQYDVNMQGVGLDGETEKETHSELIRTAAETGQPQLLWPHSNLRPQTDGKVAPGNPTRFVILLAPIKVRKKVSGLVEVWQHADRNPNAQPGFLQFMTKMAEMAASYLRQQQSKRSLFMSFLRQIWRRNR